MPANRQPAPPIAGRQWDEPNYLPNSRPNPRPKAKEEPRTLHRMLSDYLTSGKIDKKARELTGPHLYEGARKVTAPARILGPQADIADYQEQISGAARDLGRGEPLAAANKGAWGLLSALGLSELGVAGDIAEAMLVSIPASRRAKLLADPNQLDLMKNQSDQLGPRLRRAEDLESRGTDGTTIWRETGLERDQTGNWTYEIPDTNMRLKVPGNAPKPEGLSENDLEMIHWNMRGKYLEPGNYEGTVGDYVEHPELFKDFPELAERPFSLQVPHTNTAVNMAGGGRYGGRGSFSPTKKSVNALGRNPDSVKGILAHEMQHSLDDATTGLQGSSSVTMSSLNKFGLLDEYDPVRKRMKEILEKQSRNEYGIISGPLGDEYNKLQDMSYDSTDDYMRSMGEVRARNAGGQSIGGGRMGRPEEFLRETPPSMTEDISRQHQIPTDTFLNSELKRIMTEQMKNWKPVYDALARRRK